MKNLSWIRGWVGKRSVHFSSPGDSLTDRMKHATRKNVLSLLHAVVHLEQIQDSVRGTRPWASVLDPTCRGPLPGFVPRNMFWCQNPKLTAGSDRTC